jgi:hypothetical protein
MEFLMGGCISVGHVMHDWLSKQLGTERDYTHIGMFDVETCKKIIAVSNKYLIEMGSINNKQ